MGTSINCLFSRLLRHRFFAPAPKVGALGEIGIPYILYITTVLVRQPGQSSRILYTLRLLALIAMDGMYAGFALLHGQGLFPTTLLHFRPPWRSCNLVEQCRSNCRGAKACREKIRIN